MRRLTIVGVLGAGLAGLALPAIASEAARQITVAQADEEDDYVLEVEGDPATIAFYDAANLAGDLGHIESQLRVARDRVAAGDADSAANHVAKVRDGLFPLIEAELEDREIEPFNDRLSAPVEEIDFDGLIADVAEIRSGLDPGPDSLRFTVVAAVRLLYSAAEQYGVAYDDQSTLADPFDYRGAHAAAELASAWLAQVLPALAERNADDAAAVADALAEIASAFPSADAPAKAALYPGDFNAMVSVVAAAGENLGGE